MQERWDQVNRNAWQEKAPAVIADVQRRGAGCFDVNFYVNANKFDLGWILSDPNPSHLGFGHYLSNGIYEGRPVRFTC